VIEIPKVGGLHHLYTQSCLIEKDFQTLRDNVEQAVCPFACEAQFFADGRSQLNF